MKKLLLVLGLAAIMLAACSERPHRLASQVERNGAAAPDRTLDNRALNQGESGRIYH